MRSLNDISIRAKVLIVPLALVLALLVVSGLSFYGIREQNTLVKAANDIALKKIDLVDQFIILSEQVQSDVFRISALRIMKLPQEETQLTQMRLAQGLNDLTVIYGELQFRRQLNPREVDFLERLKPPLEAFRRQAQQAALVVMDNPSFGVLLVRSAMGSFTEFRTILAEFLDYQKSTMSRMAVESSKKAQIITVTIITMVLLIGLASTITTLWFSTRLISAPIIAMTALMHRLADGDLSVEVAGRRRRDEIGEMARAVEVFRNNGLQKEQLDRELRQKEDLYRLLFQQTPAGVYYYDTDLRITDCNERLASILQSTTKNLIGLDMNTLVDKRVLPTFRAALEGREGFYEGQYQATTSSAKVWLSIRTAPVSDYQGRVTGGIGLSEDITDRKQAEEKIKTSLLEKETMLKEIHHRVKNNLQVISSLLGLQSGYIRDDKSRKIFQESQDRVGVMAKIHTLLYQSEDLSRVDFGGFIRDLAGRLQQSYGTAGSPIEIYVDIADLSLTIETSIPCGLILNELVSNALKHAFTEGRGGEIHIRLTSAGDQFVFMVRDNGVGFPKTVDFQNTQTLGLELVKLLVGQINGTIDLAVDGGTKFTITFPMANQKG